LNADIKQYKKELKKWYKDVKNSKSCEYCGSDKRKQFHHLNPEEKTESIAQMVHKGYPKEEIENEMSKCIILCNSCHCRVHNKNRKIKQQLHH